LINQALTGVLPPVLITIVALWLRGHFKLGHSSTGALAAASLAAAFFATGVALDSWPLPPIDAKSWLLCAIAVSGAWVLLVQRPRFVCIGGAVLAAATTQIILGGTPDATHPWAGWDSTEALTHWLACAGVVITSWFVITVPSAKQHGALPLLLLSGTAGTASYVLMEGSSASLAQYTGALAVGLLGLAVAGARGVPIQINPAVSFICASILGHCLIAGNYLADTDTVAAAITLVSPVSLWVATRSSLQGRPLRRWLAAGLCFLVLAGLAAWRAFEMAPEGYAY
jgi:hypothetical protein